jgi:hypothetical protein
MPFNVDELFDYCRQRIECFAREHSSETFYAFAIDSEMLCLNSLEQFARTLKEYQEKWDRRTRPIENIAEMTADDIREEKFLLEMHEKYIRLDRRDDQAVLAVINEKRSRMREEGCWCRSPEGIRELRENTGDWAYQGFATMQDEDGFDYELYQDHYDEAMDSDDGHAPHTAYATAMTELVGRLRNSDAFKSLKLSPDFTVSWVDHNY